MRWFLFSFTLKSDEKLLFLVLFIRMLNQETIFSLSFENSSADFYFTMKKQAKQTKMKVQYSIEVSKKNFVLIIY